MDATPIINVDTKPTVQKGSSAQQLSLWYDTPLAKSIPNRTLNKNEMYIVVCIQQAIQELIGSRDTINRIDIDTSAIAAAREKRPRDVRKQCQDAVESLSNHFFTQTVMAYRDGKLKTIGAFAMYTSILQDEKGVIHISPNPEYVSYYRDFVVSSPDLQIPASFYLHSNSQYSYNLANWLIASIYEIRKKTKEYKAQYTVQVKEEDLRVVVPPSSPKMNKANYRERVLISAIKDINKNVYSPFQINRFDPWHAPNNKRDVIGYIFEVEILPTANQPLFFLKANTKAIDADDLPPWDVIDNYMVQIGCDKSLINLAHKNGRDRAFRSYLKVMIQPQNRHNGRYFNRVFHGVVIESVYELCMQMRDLHPELVDDYIAGVIKKHQIQEYNAVQEAIKAKEPRIKKPEDIQDLHLREIYVGVIQKIKEREQEEKSD